MTAETTPTETSDVVAGWDLALAMRESDGDPENLQFITTGRDVRVVLDALDAAFTRSRELDEQVETLTRENHLLIREKGKALGERDAAEAASYKQALATTSALADADRLRGENEALKGLLRRLSEWDHFNGAGDGPFWRREINTALTGVCEHSESDRKYRVCFWCSADTAGGGERA